ncbi:MAG: sugar ABC transporter permease, partial [Clostridia bacterium]|nr:sugar ABC transporter permease [Clostridia bacterium]
MATKKAEKQATSRELTRVQWKLKEIRENWVAYLMVAPFMFLFTIFTVLPVVLSIFISFTDFN